MRLVTTIPSSRMVIGKLRAERYPGEGAVSVIQSKGAGMPQSQDTACTYFHLTCFGDLNKLTCEPRLRGEQE